MKTFWLTIAAALIFVAALQGCATAPGSYGRSDYTPPPGYILVPAPGGNATYYGGRYGWDRSGIPSYYRGNPFYLPYYRYGYAPFFYVAPRHGCRTCGGKDGAVPAPPVDSHTGQTPPRVRPPIIEPRGDRRIPPRMRRSGYRPHVPEVPALRPGRPAAAAPNRAPRAVQPAATPVPPSVHAPNRHKHPNRPDRPRRRPPR